MKIKTDRVPLTLFAALEKIREKNGIDTKPLSRACGIGENRFSEYRALLRGEYRPRVITIEVCAQIANGLRILIGGEALRKSIIEECRNSKYSEREQALLLMLALKEENISKVLEFLRGLTDTGNIYADKT